MPEPSHHGRVARGQHLDWEGCWNARDLGGIATTDGRQIRPGALVRSESLHRLTGPGWAALSAHGIRTLVDLRNAEQAAAEPQTPPAGISTVSVPLEEGLDDDLEFAAWMSSGLWTTPLYYATFLRRWPDRCASAVAAVAHAPPGGVLVHCGKGCDRTGLVVLLLLSVAGVGPEHIVADYLLTADRLRSPAAVRLGLEDHNHEIEAVLDREGTTLRAALLDTLASVDLVACLRDGGLTTAEEAAVRQRLVAP
ncbi:hypothetical protein BH24ACT3_BH24ACT3_14570 [soil metagenome]